MKNKVLFLAGILSLFMMYKIVPFEWLYIYKCYSFNPMPSKVIIPVRNSFKKDIEDTFASPRDLERKHEGIDIFANFGEQVINANDGIVLFQGRDTYGGNVVKIYGRDNRIYYYAHLAYYIQYKIGDFVPRGQNIGYVGDSGDAVNTPPHLHFEIINIKWLFPLIKDNANPYLEF